MQGAEFSREVEAPPCPEAWRAEQTPGKQGYRSHRVLRGGSWNNNNPTNLLSSYRNNNHPTNRNDNNGFRVVLGVGGGGKALPVRDRKPRDGARESALPAVSRVQTAGSLTRSA